MTSTPAVDFKASFCFLTKGFSFQPRLQRSFALGTLNEVSMGKRSDWFAVSEVQFTFCTCTVKQIKRPA